MTTLIFQKNQRSCASFSINVAILFLLFKRTTTVANKSIDKENTDRIHVHSHISTSQPRSLIYYSKEPRTPSRLREK